MSLFSCLGRKRQEERGLQLNYSNFCPTDQETLWGLCQILSRCISIIYSESREITSASVMNLSNEHLLSGTWTGG